jgi:hypothetical protein
MIAIGMKESAGSVVSYVVLTVMFLALHMTHLTVSNNLADALMIA